MLARSAVLRRALASRLETRTTTARPRRTAYTATAMADIQGDQPVTNKCTEATTKVEPRIESAEVPDLKDLKIDGKVEKKEEKKAEKQEEKLPKLSASEFRTYNRMAEAMQYYHNHFRHTWTTLYTACENNKRPAGMSIRQFLSTGLQFCSQLTMHHDIEEVHIFPVLARKMPAFKAEMEMKTAHKQIHDGLERLEPWLEEVRGGERELNLKELKGIMDTFGKVLWQHLDEEVQELGAENMRKYWTISEMQRMPM